MELFLKMKNKMTAWKGNYMTNKQLVAYAIKAKENSYSPYSKFRVGACLLCEDGSVYTGCNIENVAYGPSNCAERTAIFKAVSEGNTKFKKIAIAVDGQNFGYPCGVCRQVMAEFCDNLDIIVANQDGKFVKTTLKELLPQAFKF